MCVCITKTESVSAVVAVRLEYDHSINTTVYLSIFLCECGISQKKLGYKLHVHHGDYNKKNNNSANLTSLCRSCHTQTNFNRKDWTKYFKKLNKERSHALVNAS